MLNRTKRGLKRLGKSIKNNSKWCFRKIRSILIELIVIGIFWATFVFLFSKIDNAIIYDPKLQSIRKVKRTINNYNWNKINHYAILVSGNGAIISNVKGSKKNLQTAYDALKKRGYSDQSIIILSSTIPKGRKLNTGITTRPKPANLKFILEHILKNIKKQGSITFYFTGHGSRRKEKSSIFLGNQKIKQDDFYQYFELLKNIKKIFILEQDYSGGFANELKKLPNVTIMSATKKNKMVINAPSVERIFWDKISKGEDAKKAYKKSVKEIGLGHQLVIDFFEIVSLGSAHNYYLVYSNSKADIAKPAKKQ
tara:strand:+ start:10589 stop:11518 length:930 start_codon:yes stop_codon:yes gene_type:complete